MIPSTLKEKLNVSHYNILHLKQSLIEQLWNHKTASLKEPGTKTEKPAPGTRNQEPRSKNQDKKLPL